MIYKHSKEGFFNIVNSATYKNQDEIEARQYLSASVAAMYEGANHQFAKYYTIQEDEKVLVTIMLQRDGKLVYFVTTSFTSDYMYKVIRAVRELADTTVQGAGPITTTTADFYKEALQFNRIVGFKILEVHLGHTVWVYDNGWE